MATRKNKEEEDVKAVADIWSRYTNPLRSLNSYEIGRLLDNARLGDDVKLQVAYFEIERSTPIFSVCISKRLSGMQNRQWAITKLENTAEAETQRAEVQKMFDRADTLNETGLSDAMRHLDMATFRGRSAVKPFFDDDGNLFFKKLENWNFVRYNGVNYWNPEAIPTYLFGDTRKNSKKSLEELGLARIPDGEVAYITDDKCLDWCGLTIYLRQLIGEDNWSRACEVYGIPQILITCPEGTPDTDVEKWNWRAQGIYEGGSGALPSGAKVEALTEGRGQDVFSAYIRH